MPQLDVMAYGGEYLWAIVAMYVLQMLLIRGVMGDMQRQAEIRGDIMGRDYNRGIDIEELLMEVMGENKR